MPGFVELADEESERVWHGLICLPAKGGTWTRRTNREAPRPRACVQSCVLIITYIVSTDSIITNPPPLLSHVLDTPSLSSWKAGPLRTSRTDRQTLAHFLVRGASYTLIPKPYLDNAQVITSLDNAHPQNNSSVPPLRACPAGKNEFLLDEARASPWRSLVRSRSNHGGGIAATSSVM